MRPIRSHHQCQRRCGPYSGTSTARNSRRAPTSRRPSRCRSSRMFEGTARSSRWCAKGADPGRGSRTRALSRAADRSRCGIGGREACVQERHEEGGAACFRPTGSTSGSGRQWTGKDAPALLRAPEGRRADGVAGSGETWMGPERRGDGERPPSSPTAASLDLGSSMSAMPVIVDARCVRLLASIRTWMRRMAIGGDRSAPDEHDGVLSRCRALVNRAANDFAGI